MNESFTYRGFEAQYNKKGYWHIENSRMALRTQEVVERVIDIYLRMNPEHEIKPLKDLTKINLPKVVKFQRVEAVYSNKQFN